MKPQTAAFLEKARHLLENAATMLRVGLYEDAGRTAYLAGFHAAQAVLLERTDKVFKTHRGVQGEFARLVHADPSFDRDVRVFLSRTYGLKAMADYESGPDAKLNEQQAVEAVMSSGRFVECLAKSVDTDSA